ncbi:MAG: vanadium-dependent haloperoxidase [Gemmatimonadaceae bacterium]
MSQLEFRTRVRRIAIVACVTWFSAAIASCRTTNSVKPDFVAAWVRTWYGATRVERLSPPVASRAIAYAAAALYAGIGTVNSGLPALDSTLNGVPQLPRAERPSDEDGTLIAVAAERVVLDSMWIEALPTTRAAFTRLADSLRSDRIAHGVSNEMAARADSLGMRIGLAIAKWASSDGFAATRGRQYPPPKGVGVWYNDAPANIYATQNMSGASEYVALDNPSNQLRSGNTSDRGLILSRPKGANTKTLPAANMAGATEPYWGEVRPFVLRAWDACPVAPPFPYDTSKGSAINVNARAVYDAQLALTPEQRTIAYYWADNAGESGTPSGHWLAIASQMISERHLDAADAVRAVLATAVAQADAFIAAWGYKYRYVVIRPRTYIRRTIDPKWEPLIPTPPFPEHPAGHSTQSAAAAEVLTALIGVTPFTDSTGISIGHGIRHFESFVAASEEAGMSRVYGGIHFPSGNDGGRALGKCIGAAVVKAFGASKSH